MRQMTRTSDILKSFHIQGESERNEMDFWYNEKF